MLNKTLIKYSNSFVSRWLVFAIDVCIIFFALYLAFILRFNFEVQKIDWERFLFSQPFVTAIYAFSFLIFKSYYGVIRHTSLEDAIKIFKSLTIGAVVLIFVSILSLNNPQLTIPFTPISIVIIHYLISLSGLIVSRFVFKVVYRKLTTTVGGDVKNIIIFGAGAAGIMAKNTLAREDKLNYKVVGFADDNESKVKKSIEGVNVYSAYEAFSDFLSKKKISEVIISTQLVSPQRKREIIDICLQYNVSVRTVPPVEKWINGELSANQIKKVRIEDLLGRETIKLEKDHIRSEIRGKVILITGAAGSIGSEIVRQAYYYSPTAIIMVDQSETGLFEIENEISILPNKNVKSIPIIADVRNCERIREVFETYKVDMVFHAAAYKHVPMMERHPSEAVTCNVLGTKNMADLSREFNIEKFVMVSTDKAVNPTNIMGASKRIAEMYVQSLNNDVRENNPECRTQYITTRFGNVLGSNGSVIPIFRRQIENGGPLIVTHPEITRYFMTIPEACQLVLEAGIMGNGGEIFIFDMGKSIKILDLAKKMIKLSGLELGKDIKIEFSGLREGEKLYEELLNNKETSVPTHHEKILIASVRKVAYAMMSKNINELRNLVGGVDDMPLVRKMKEVVPEFISNSSKFEVLDNVQQSIVEESTIEDTSNDKMIA